MTKKLSGVYFCQTVKQIILKMEFEKWDLILYASKEQYSLCFITEVLSIVSKITQNIFKNS